MPHLRTSTYTLAVNDFFEEDLFTRHPLTGNISRHQYPYTTLPKFTLHVHPCIAALRAGIFAGLDPEQTPISNNLLAISRLHARCRTDIPPRPRPTKALSATSNTHMSASSSRHSTAPEALSSCAFCPSASLVSSAAARSYHSSCSHTARPQKRKTHTESTAAPARPSKLQRRELPMASVRSSKHAR
ncbi:hypothetical protein CYLTODRAFT_259616 [Cylindrobasidium torrendii FP15055 ss-10]|uniref:Uncharacterized protein n=1 Tax=Cylindrobasidium torrendii FP15055 ss-10 TaxID=1314674 RepID=A0A0D7BE91_9AGAR|nr:hypothetical protein CYLTODRAFT_259616 [Cylindrobasidium torrendii FP15055 ss-10]